MGSWQGCGDWVRAGGMLYFEGGVTIILCDRLSVFCEIFVNDCQS